jgi:hypothetical protein
VLPDGVFMEEGDEGEVDFLRLAPPTREQLPHVLERVVVKRLARVRLPKPGAAGARHCFVLLAADGQQAGACLGFVPHRAGRSLVAGVVYCAAVNSPICRAFGRREFWVAAAAVSAKLVAGRGPRMNDFWVWVPSHTLTARTPR